MPEDTAFIQVYTLYFDTVYRLCCIRLRSQTEAEDVTQETFFRAMQHTEVWQSGDEGYTKAWLLTTASNLCKNINSHWTHTRRVDLSEWACAVETAPPPDDTRSDVLSAMLRLPDHYKTVLYLFYYEGYSGTEIAEMLQKKESTVRTLLSRGRKLLKKYLGGAQNAK